jgi:hypothetical protein
MAFLGILNSPEYLCGLDGDFSGAALQDWQALVQQDVLRLLRQFAGSTSRRVGELHAVRFKDSPTWVVVAHPLWDALNPQGVLLSAREQLGGESYAIVDSFNLARRPWTISGAVAQSAAKQ